MARDLSTRMDQLRQGGGGGGEGCGSSGLWFKIEIGLELRMSQV